jgi:4-hydroxy-3-polyprenylbenzoate decarboxylase
VKIVVEGERAWQEEKWSDRTHSFTLEKISCVRDPDSVNWALSFRTQPHRDVKIMDSGTMGLDPSVSPPEDWVESRSAVAKVGQASVLCIDATRPWPYKPTSLPRRDFMEGALNLWKRLELPPLKLKEPWFGYELGHWSDRNREEAELGLQGKHFEIGERIAKERKKFD